MSLFDTISNDIKSAMLAKDRVKLEALRGVKKEFNYGGFPLSFDYDGTHFYVGTSYRHCLIWNGGEVVELTTEDIFGY